MHNGQSLANPNPTTESTPQLWTAIPIHLSSQFVEHNMDVTERQHCIEHIHYIPSTCMARS